MPSHTVHADCTVCALYDNVVPCRVREGVYLRGCRRGGVAHREGSTGGGSGAWPGPPSHGVLLAGRCRGQAGGEILPWVSILENRNPLLCLAEERSFLGLILFECWGYLPSMALALASESLLFSEMRAVHLY